MPGQIAVQRMDNTQLWRHLTVSLRTLANAYLGELTHVERRGLARRALACAEELQLRGEQLKLDVTHGNVRSQPDRQ